MNRIIKTILGWIFPGRLLLKRVKNGRRHIALTFDDGPHPENTKALLDILHSEKVKATFFLLGETIEKYPGLIRKMVESGHEIGNHSFSHIKISEIGAKRYWDGVQRTSDLLHQYAKTKISLFRPPYGELNLSILKHVLVNKLVLVNWSLDSNDSWIKDKNKLTQYIKTKNVRSGDIILFHEDYKVTIDAIKGIITDLKERGFIFVTISELKGAR